MSADTILIKYFFIFLFYFCNILKGKIRAIFSNFAVSRFKRNGRCRKSPDIFFLIKKKQTLFLYSPCLSRAVWPVNLSHKLSILEKFGTGYCTYMCILPLFYASGALTAGGDSEIFQGGWDPPLPPASLFNIQEGVNWYLSFYFTKFASCYNLSPPPGDKGGGASGPSSPSACPCLNQYINEVKSARTEKVSFAKWPFLFVARHNLINL